MEILIIILLSILVILGVLLLFKIFKWFFLKKDSVIRMLILFITVIMSITISKLFFVKMEFIQSSIYPDLYLIKNPVKDKNAVNKAIKEKVIKLTNNQFKGKGISKNSQFYSLRFYEYNKGDWGENGTAYFIEHEERRDGMLAELLEYYPEYLLAAYSLQPCKINSDSYFGKLDYYNNRKRIKTDTLLNSCK